MANAVTAGQATSNLQNYANQLYQSLISQAPSLEYTPRTEAQLKDNLLKSYQASYDQSVASRKQNTRQNRGAIDADAASRGMGASTWVTDAKMRQNDSEARDLNTLRINRDSTIAQQLAAALGNQEDNELAVKQYNAGIKATALNNALSTAGSMYDRFKAEDPALAAASGGGGYAGGGYSGGGGGGSGSGNYGSYSPATKQLTPTERYTESEAQGRAQAASLAKINAAAATSRATANNGPYYRSKYK